MCQHQRLAADPARRPARPIPIIPLRVPLRVPIRTVGEGHGVHDGRDPGDELREDDRLARADRERDGLQ